MLQVKICLASGRSAAWPAHLHGAQGVGGSSPLVPTIVKKAGVSPLFYFRYPRTILYYISRSLGSLVNEKFKDRIMVSCIEQEGEVLGR